MIIGIVGAGASGMAAALAASENQNVQILLFERQNRVGRKLQATGNGRCNLTNLHASSENGYYHGENAGFAIPALQKMTPEATLNWFFTMGLITVSESSGRVYPYSDQANSVVDVLRFALERKNIQVLTGCEVSKIRKTGDGFSVNTEDNVYHCDKLIVACGGLAGTKLGGTMSGYKLLSKLGHHCTKLRPALVQLKSGWNGIAGLKGVRANCRARILRDGMKISESTGELQFTEYGISGPVVFEISREACQSTGLWQCNLDFLPHMTEEMLLDMLLVKRRGNLPVDELLTGILHNRLGRVLTKTVGIKTGMVRDLSVKELQAVCHAVKSFDISLSEPMGMDSAQVTAGGIVTSEFDPETMESRLIPGLYACGEVLDIDGDCGGFNLQWAWSSGYLAGHSAGKDNI